MHADNESRGTLIVTGGSRGIGAAISRLAAVQGYSVVVNFSENDKAAAALINEIQRSGGRCTAIRADVASETDVQYLRVYIRSLRQKIEADPERPRHILTETGVGYRLRAPDWDAVATPSGS